MVKRPASGSSKTDPVKSRCKLIKDAIQGAECDERVQEMLCGSLSVTVGAFKANRHAFNERFVTMIGEVLAAEHARLKKDVETKEAAFAALTPAKATREQDQEKAAADAVAKGEAFDNAKTAVAEASASLKDLNAAAKEAEKARKSGDEGLVEIEGKKAKIVEVQTDSLAPLLDGSASDEDKIRKAKAVLDMGKTYSFDASLLSTAEPVLQKALADRGAFDGTCLEQLQAAFTSAVAGLDAELAAGAPGKAERAAAVATAEAAKQAGEAHLADTKEKSQAAKEAKAAADAAEKEASKNLSAFMPDLKEAGDGLDTAKEDLKDFEEGALTAFGELKDLTEADLEKWEPKSYYEQIDGMKLDREVIDACRTAVGDGIVSLDDAKKVFVKVADGNRVTQCERWTVRYCLQEFKWSQDGHDWLVESLKAVSQEGMSASPAKKAKKEGAGYYETVDGFKCDRGIVDACREASNKEGGDGRISDEDARKVWEKAADGNEVTNAEKWTIRYCLSGFKWQQSAYDWIWAELRKA